MARPPIRHRNMSRAFGQTLQQRVVAVAVIVCVVAIGAAAVLIDARHSTMVFDQVALEGRLLIAQLAEARIAHDLQRGERGLRVVLAQRFESLFPFDEGRSAFITLGDDVLWQSDNRLERPPSPEPATQGHWEGLAAISHAGRTYEAYLIRSTETREWPVPSSTAESPGAERLPETYAVTFHVGLVTDTYRREITAFRNKMTAVVAIAIAVLGAAMFVVMRRQLRPLDRITRRVSELEAWSGQRIEPCDGDPQEIRTLAARFNEFLQKLDDTGGWEKTCHGKLRTVLQEAERDLSPESQINHKGFMHSLSHLLSAIPLTEFKTIPEEEKEAVHKDFMRVRSMIERKLHDLVVRETTMAAASADVVAVAREFFSLNRHSAENFMQSFMRRRHPDRSFEHHHFSLRHEEGHLHARIDKNYLYEMMFNLLHNAGKAATGQVRLTIARRGGMVRIAVENDGKRFPTTGRESLMVWRGSTDGEGEGRGIGLPYVRRIARDHDGDLTLEDSDDLGGARAVLELPLVDVPAADAAGNDASDDPARRTLPPPENRAPMRAPASRPTRV